MNENLLWWTVSEFHVKRWIEARDTCHSSEGTHTACFHKLNINCGHFNMSDVTYCWCVMPLTVLSSEAEMLIRGFYQVCRREGVGLSARPTIRLLVSLIRLSQRMQSYFGTSKFAAEMWLLLWTYLKPRTTLLPAHLGSTWHMMPDASAMLQSEIQHGDIERAWALVVMRCYHLAIWLHFPHQNNIGTFLWSY